MTATIKLPLTLPAPDAPDDVIARHFMTVQAVFAVEPFDITTIMCYTCCKVGENTLNRSAYGSRRLRSCSEPCAALYERRYGATAPVQATAAEGGDEEETDDMAKAKTGKGAKASPAARKRKAAPSRVQSARKPNTSKADAQARTEQAKFERKAAGAKIDPATLRAGMKLAARHKGVDYGAQVVANGDGVAIRYSGVEYKSLSAAGSAITGGAVNGRAFWTVA